jgi:hypothetical protein
MTAAELRGLLTELLVGAAGGTADRWSDLLGRIEERSIIENIHSNWRISPTAEGDERHAIDTAIELVRRQHPYIHG